MLHLSLLSLPGNTVVFAVGADYAAVPGLGFQVRATPGAAVKEQSIIGRNLDFLYKPANRASQVSFRNKGHHLLHFSKRYSKEKLAANRKRPQAV